MIAGLSHLTCESILALSSIQLPIDEVDAHVHIELQNRVLPGLFQLFPKVQFILSSHSPVFVLGMEKSYGASSLQVVEMPTGTPVGAESYEEFGKVLEAVAATSAFTQRVIDEARISAKPVIFVEGETDGPYLKRAADLLERSSILTRCDIEWIGAKDISGQGFNTGKDAMKHALSVLRANPDLANRRVLFLNDNDTTAPDLDEGAISVRTLPTNPSNQKVKSGIENLLSESAIDDRFFEEKDVTKPNGNRIKTWTLNKSVLCNQLCQNGTSDQFEAFSGALDILSGFLES